MKMILCIICFLYNEHSFAQENAETSIKRFGLFGGLNVSNMNFNKGFPTPSVHIAPSWQRGITVGFMMHVPLYKEFSLQPEYAYTHRRGSDKSIGINYSTDYLSLPVLLKYHISNLLQLVAGPQIELLINSKATANGATDNITHEIEERSLGAVVGFNVQLNRSLIFSTRYLHGINHINIHHQSNQKEFKYEVVNVLIGFGF